MSNATNGSMMLGTPRTSSGARTARRRSRRRSPASPRAASGAAWLAALALVAVGCGHGAGHGGSSVDLVEHLFETEPNDHAWNADFFGALRLGDRLVIHGGVDDFGPDLRDGFAFVSAAAGHIDFSLRSIHGADLDLCIYDAETDEIVFCFESPYDPERGGFEMFGGGGEFHFVVSSFAGSSDYELEIAVSSPSAAAATHAAPERGARERVASYLREPSVGAAAAEGADDDLAPLLFGLDVTVDTNGRIRRQAFRLDAAGRLLAR